MSGKEWRKYTVAWCIMLVLFTATQCMETYLAVSEDVTTEIRIFKHVIQAGLREVPWGKQKDVEKAWSLQVRIYTCLILPHPFVCLRGCTPSKKQHGTSNIGPGGIAAHAVSRVSLQGCNEIFPKATVPPICGQLYIVGGPCLKSWGLPSGKLV